MDRITTNKQAAKRIVEAFTESWQPHDGTETRTVIDDQHGHYQVVNSGQLLDRFVSFCFIDLDVKPNGRVHILKNDTEWEIDLELIEAGVAPADIIIDWQTEVSAPP